MRERKSILILLAAMLISTALFFDLNEHRVFDLSKIRTLYISLIAILILWGIGRHGLRLYWKENIPLTIFAMVTTSAVSASLSINKSFSFYGAWNRFDGFISFVAYAFLFFVVVNFVERKHIDKFFSIIILAGCASSIYGIAQRYGIDYTYWLRFWLEFEGDTWDLDYGCRPFSTFGHPAFFAAYLIMTVPAVLFKIFTRNRLWIIALLLILTGLYFTKTRACFVGLVISCVFFFWHTRRTIIAHNKTTLIAALVGVFLLLAVLGVTSKGNNVYNRFADELRPGRYHVGSIYLRTINWKMAMLVIRDYPVWGIGQDCLILENKKYLKEVYSKVERPRRHFNDAGRIHCWPLDVAQSRGLVGLAAFGLFIYAFTKRVWRPCRQGNLLVITLTAGCIAYAVQNLFSFGHIPIITLFWFFVGLAFIATRETHGQRQSMV